MAEEIKKGIRKTNIGIVVSDKMEKTVVVMVSTKKMHPAYKKYTTKRAKFMAHDPKNECSIGDKVMIMETRPLSNKKRWVVKSIIEKAS
jgi:small subunit ribosomal protein S17